MTRKDRWILSEYLVACDRVGRLGEDLAAHRVRTPYAEVDLVFERAVAGGISREFVVVEVKSSSNTWSAGLMPARQRLRLERARWFLENRTGRSCVLVLAVVSPANKITYFDAPWW